MNFDKYNPIRQAKPSLNDWHASTPVVLLSEYLKMHKDQGIILRQTEDGIPCLSFNPGLSKGDQENGRWLIAMHAKGLLLDAADDLKELIANGKLTLPISNQRKHGG